MARTMSGAQKSRSAASRRLSTGKRVNQAADGPSSVALSQRLRAMSRSLAQAQRNAMDGQSMAQTAEGGVQRLQAIVSELRQHALRASTDIHDGAMRQTMDLQYKSLLTAYDQVVNSVDFNGQLLLGPGSGSQRPVIQVGVDGSVASRFEVALSDVSLRQVGRIDPLAGASVVSSAPLGALSVAEPDVAASLTLSGDFTFEDTAALEVPGAGPFVIDARASVDLGAGPYTFSGTATRTSSRAGSFTIPPAASIQGTDTERFDVVAGENAVLRLSLNGAEEVVRLEPGFRTLDDGVASINDQVVGVAGVEGGHLVLRAGGEAAALRLRGGSALTVLGLSAGSSSSGQNSLVFSTPGGTVNVTFAEGTYTTDAAVDIINGVSPGAAFNDGGRIGLQATGGQTRLTVGSGSANGILGFAPGTTNSTDNFRYRLNQGAWQSVDLPDGTLSANDMADLINARTPGAASVQGGRVRIASESGAAHVQIGSGTANAALGVFTGQFDSGENALTMRVNGTTRSILFDAGTYSAQDVRDRINGAFAGLASIDGGKLKLETSNPGGIAEIVTGGSTLNQALGLPSGASATSSNVLRLRVNNGAERAIAFAGGALTPQEVADTINATFPDLALVNGGNVVLRSEGAGAALRIGNGSGNGALGVANGQSASVPPLNQDLRFSINGEETIVDFAPGNYSPQAIVSAINDVRPGFATLLQDGRLRLATQSVGTVNTVSIGNGSLNGALGFSSGQSGTGVDTDSLALTDLLSLEGSQQAYQRATQALDELSAVNADLGAFMNQSSAISDQLSEEMATTEITRSRIEDADMAREATELARAEIMANTVPALMGAVEMLESSVANILLNTVS